MRSRPQQISVLAFGLLVSALSHAEPTSKCKDDSFYPIDISIACNNKDEKFLDADPKRAAAKRRDYTAFCSLQPIINNSLSYKKQTEAFREQETTISDLEMQIAVAKGLVETGQTTSWSLAYAQRSIAVFTTRNVAMAHAGDLIRKEKLRVSLDALERASPDLCKILGLNGGPGQVAFNAFTGYLAYLNNPRNPASLFHNFCGTPLTTGQYAADIAGGANSAAVDGNDAEELSYLACAVGSKHSGCRCEACDECTPLISAKGYFPSILVHSAEILRESQNLDMRTTRATKRIRDAQKELSDYQAKLSNVLIAALNSPSPNIIVSINSSTFNDLLTNLRIPIADAETISPGKGRDIVCAEHSVITALNYLRANRAIPPADWSKVLQQTPCP